jgi:hypothetical protein
MGTFAAFCKGETMGAFLLLPLRAGQVFCHDSLMAAGHHLREEVAAAANHSVRIRQEVIAGWAEQLTQAFPTLAKRSPQQGVSLVEEQIEDHIVHRHSLVDGI